MKWISTQDKLPLPGENVRLADLRFNPTSSPTPDIWVKWETTGWITKSGYWSLAKAEGVNFLSKPTHWQPF